MNADLFDNLKSLIMFMHLSGLAFGVGGAWILDLYILRKMHASLVTKEHVQIITFVSKVVIIGLILLWLSGTLFLIFYSLVEPELLRNPKIWAKVVIVIVLTINGYFLHKVVLPVISSNQGALLISKINLKEMNVFMLTGCVSFVTWPFVMILGTFASLNFAFSFFAIIAFYLLTLTLSVAVASILKGFLLEKEMSRKIKVLNEDLLHSNTQLALKQSEIGVLTKVLKRKPLPP